MILARQSPFIVDLIAYCADSTGTHQTVIEEQMSIGKYHDDSQYDFIKDTDQYATAAMEILGGVKALNSQGRLLADYGPQTTGQSR